MSVRREEPSPRELPAMTARISAGVSASSASGVSALLVAVGVKGDHARLVGGGLRAPGGDGIHARALILIKAVEVEIFALVGAHVILPVDHGRLELPHEREQVARGLVRHQRLEFQRPHVHDAVEAV